MNIAPVSANLHSAEEKLDGATILKFRFQNVAFRLKSIVKQESHITRLLL